FLARRLRRFKTQVAVVDWLERTALVLFNIAAANDPFATQLWQAFTHVGANGRIAVRATGVIDAHGRIRFQLILEVARRVLIDLAKGHAHAGLLAVDVDAS